MRPCTPNHQRTPSLQSSSHYPAAFERIVSSKPTSPWSDGPKGEPADNPCRPFDPQDFLTENCQWPSEQIAKYLKEFPALTKRNFFVLQRHEMAPDNVHWDLRLQLDGMVITFAVLTHRGIEDPPPRGVDEDSFGGRMAVEEDGMELGISLTEEGSRVGVMCVEDVGKYKILPRMKDVEAEQRRKATNRKKDLTDDTTTDEEESDAEEPEDWRQETLFAQALFHASFLPLPPRHGHPGRIAERDNGQHRGFVIELNGARHKGLRLDFARGSSFLHNTLNKDGRSGVHRRYQHYWHFNLDTRPGSRGQVIPSYGRSILTKRSMSEIIDAKQAKEDEEREWKERLRKSAGGGKKVPRGRKTVNE